MVIGRLIVHAQARVVRFGGSGVPAFSDEDRWRRCHRWFERAVADVQELTTYRLIWKNVLAMLQSNPDIRHTRPVNTYLAATYRTTMAMGVRRQSQTTGGLPTIGCVLSEIAAYPGIATKAQFIADAADPALAEAAWPSVAGGSHTSVDRAAIAADLTSLANSEHPIRAFVNARLAHLGGRARDSALRLGFPEVDQGVDELVRLSEKYYGLFHPGVSLQITPYLPLGWTRMFESPWIGADFVPVDPS